MKLKLAITAFFISLSACVWSPDVFAGTVTLRPNGDPASPVWARYSGSSNWSVINQAGTSTSNYICRAGNSASDVYDLSNEFVGQGVTSMTVRAYAAMARTLLVVGDDQISLGANVNGSLVGATANSVPTSTILSLLPSCPGTVLDLLGWTYGWITPATYNGSWSQADIDGMKLHLGKTQIGGTADPIRVVRGEVEVTYIDPPSLEQYAYRAYANTNTLNPGAPLATTNTGADVVADNGQVRIRLGARVSSGEYWRANYGSIKLQYAPKSGGACSASSGWADVAAGSGVIRWKDNAAVADGAALTSYASDPATGGTMVHQQYRESNSAKNSASVPVSQIGLWDFSLSTVGGSPGQTYCLRLVTDEGSIPLSYNQYPELTLTGDLNATIVDASGSAVSVPSVTFSSAISGQSCQLVTAVLGANSQRIRVSNNIAKNGWSMSIAPTGGSGSSWQSGANAYAFNRSDGSPTGCTHGQLALEPSSATISSAGGCTATGLSLGGNASFVSGSSDAVTLATASPSSQRFCYWDITNIAAKQRIPAAKPAGVYKLDLTITVLAQ